ncbi:MAG TPA: ABC transporter ATP-binding protein [Thermoplasmata archaeon]|nr:ABC transporter ATP-binding protein [Thermoplasmata archaeon]
MKTYFHTYEGTVRALEGIDLVIRSGETVGLVGETGCGKSVTALSILRLIPSPPGTIEAGRVFLEEPEDVHRFREEYDGLARQRMTKNPGAGAISSAVIRENLQPEIDALRAKLSAAPSEPEKRLLEARLRGATSDFDILQKPVEDLRSIRGNKISMIFQEPMTAMNPVFTIGDQIAETLVLHRKEELCRNVLASLDLQLNARSKKIRGKRLRVGDVRQDLDEELVRIAHEEQAGRAKPSGLPQSREQHGSVVEIERRERELAEQRRRLEGFKEDDTVCSACWSLAPNLWDWCPSCGARLTFDWLAPLRGRVMAVEKRLYQRMVTNSKDQLVDFVNSWRILRRLVRTRLHDEGVRWAVRMLDEVKIPEPVRIAGQYPFELSGGMRQRSMIAMMLACNPILLIADEPTTALDVTVEAQILKLMKELQAKTNMAVLLITHDLGIVAEVCDKVGVMYAGSIAEFGTTEQVFHRMMHPYTNGLMQSIPRFKGTDSQARKRDLYIIHGTVPNLLHPPSGCRFHPRCSRATEVCAEKNPPLEELEPGHLVACHNPIRTEEGLP